MKQKHDIVYEMGEVYEWDKWIKEIPYLSFPSEFEVRAIPPYGCGVIRYNIKYNGNFCSVYLDCYGMLGCVNEPYWEVYPHNDDVYRCLLKDTDELIGAIYHSLGYKND